jgi:hypothetical protein
VPPSGRPIPSARARRLRGPRGQSG